MTENSIEEPDYAAEIAAKIAAQKSKERRRYWVVAFIALIIALTGVFVIKNMVDNHYQGEANQIAAASKFAADRDWAPTGWWHVDSRDIVMGQVVLGTCVYDVHGPASLPNQLQVSLPESYVGTSSDNTVKRPAFRPFEIAKLSAAAAKSDRWRMNVTQCFPASLS